MICRCPHCRNELNCQGLSGVVECPTCHRRFAVPGATPPIPVGTVAPTPPAVRNAHGRSPQKPSWWDRQFEDFGVVAKFVLPLLCNGPALVLGILGLILCKNRRARESALWITVFSGT